MSCHVFSLLGPQDFSHSSVLLTAAAVRVWEKFILLKKDVSTHC
jgi:hypothetical protein